MHNSHLTIDFHCELGFHTAIAEAVQRLLSGHDDWVSIKKNDRNTIAYHPELGVYFKSFYRNSVTERLKSIFSGGRAHRTLKGTRLLQAANCLAPDILATGRYSNNDFIIMEALNGPPLLNTLESYLKDKPDSQWRNDLFRELGFTIGKMHAQGVIHGDLRGNNVVIVPDHDCYRLAMIDNERTRKAFRFKREQRRNLKQIMLFGPHYITSSERDMFFDCYFQAFPHSSSRAKLLVKCTFDEVEEHFQRKGIVQGTPLEPIDYWPTIRSLQPLEVSQHNIG
ncbi:lipopolysaccharide kinase InaA family protein [Alcanivorax sediminis]|uniref:Serine/threonine protein kinase n=1 Tax=Alcanivorax sediminis TaxID=2663008 RepID=A0A6N7LWT7_9GAMM|nr:lipopolysaccharide kinase InaA family protein [Alcanivorax sediminis]MQX52701.1 serine/threonine protein kinase [Alcanivorax sediminis]